MNSYADIWESVKCALREALTDTAVETWFDEVYVTSVTDKAITLAAPVDFKRETIINRYIPRLTAVISDVFAGPMEVNIVSGMPVREAVRGDIKPAEDQQREMTFENFVVGATNKFAHAAAKYVSENLGRNYNPLFLYGESGVGKTHLLYAIKNVVEKQHPEYKTICKRGDEFTNELILAIGAGRNKEFRDTYRNADLFLMDDIQFIAGKDSTQEEFFHTFNSLFENGKQIVLTSDRPPKEMARLENRLQTRFEWGLVADIQPPDYETRVAIVSRKASLIGLLLEDTQAAYIAGSITSNVRQIEGTVNKIFAYRQLGDEKLAKEAIFRAVEDMKKDKGDSEPPPELVIDEICSFFQLSREELMGRKKTREIAEGRQFAMYMMRKLTNMSFSEIGKVFGGKDHTTVMHAVEKIEKKVNSEAAARDAVRDMTSNIKERM